MGFVTALANLLFPGRCVFCHRIKDGDNGTCPECAKKLEYTSAAGARTTGEFFEECFSPFYYEGLVRESILRYKFQDREIYAQVYGKYLADCVRQHFSGKYDLISWVPLSKRRRRKRGYDQAQVLAEAMSRELGETPVRVLRKKRDIPAQSGIKGAEKRRANVLGVYETQNEELVYGKTVLLVDDVVTTGATLSECARTLRMSGAAKVICVSMAKRR